MSSIIKVNTFQDANGNALFSSDGSGNVTTSATGLQNTPAFEAYLSGGDQTIANNTVTKINLNAERYDTNSAYDTSTYTFTVPTAGKYFIYGRLQYGGATNGTTVYIMLYKNGSEFAQNFRTGYNGNKVIDFYNVVDCSVSDYFEVYTYQNSGVSQVLKDANILTTFGAFKIIGA